MVQPLGKKMLVWTVLLEVLFVEASFYIDRIVQNTEKKLVLSNPRFGDGLQYEGLSPKFAIDGQGHETVIFSRPGRAGPVFKFTGYRAGYRFF